MFPQRHKDMLIVTHFNPDIDAISAVWLLKKFGPQQFHRAEVKFVPAGETWQNQPVDSDPAVVHVDTGLGQFDHHQDKDKSICAARLVLDFIKKELGSKDLAALERLVEVVRSIDHFEECGWPEAEADRYEFMLMSILSGLKVDNELDDNGLVDFGSVCLTGIFQSIKRKIKAQADIKGGISIKTKWGKSLFIESSINEGLHLAQKQGFNLVVRKDPRLGMVKIALRPDSAKDLAKVYQYLQQHERRATWFYHSSGKLLLNGSTKNPKMKPSKLSLTELMDIIKGL